MNAELLIFLGAVVAAVLFIVDRQGKRLADSIPPDMIVLFELLLDVAGSLAERTPTPDDDALIAKIRAALDKPAPEPPPFADPTELAARLDPSAQG